MGTGVRVSLSAPLCSQFHALTHSLTLNGPEMQMISSPAGADDVLELELSRDRLNSRGDAGEDVFQGSTLFDPALPTRQCLCVAVSTRMRLCSSHASACAQIPCCSDKRVLCCLTTPATSDWSKQS